MNEIALIIGIISFPGLIATVLCDKLLVHAERWDSFKYLIYTFIFGVSAYVALQTAVWILSATCLRLPFLGHSSSLGIWGTPVSAKELNFAEVFWATTLAPSIAFLAVYLVNKKIIYRLGQKLSISNKYGDENLFSYFLNSPDVEWVYVRDPSIGISYRGLIRSFSETKEVQELVMTNVTVYSYPDSDKLYNLSHIYLSKPLGSFIIETPAQTNKGESND